MRQHGAFLEKVDKAFIFPEMVESEVKCEALDIQDDQYMNLIWKLNGIDTHFKLNTLYYKLYKLYFKLDTLYFKLNALYFKLNALYFKLNAIYFELNTLYFNKIRSILF